jgi:phosphohistidine phosphatase
MNLYIVRHAEAADEQVDPERKLTDQGQRDADSLGKFLAALALEPKEIWHSPKPRAAQTALAIASALGANEKLVIHDGLLPNDRVKPIAKVLKNEIEDLMIVGHDPFLTRLASRLLIRKASFPLVDLGKPSLLHLVRHSDESWTIAQLLTPAIFAQQARGTENP